VVHPGKEKTQVNRLFVGVVVDASIQVAVAPVSAEEEITVAIEAV